MGVMRNVGGVLLPGKCVFGMDEYQWSVQSQMLFFEPCNIVHCKNFLVKREITLQLKGKGAKIWIYSSNLSKWEKKSH